jgi:VCBS repeat-containing protein
VAAAQGVLANDIDTAGDTLTATIVTSVSHGTLTLNSNGSFTYTPAAGYTGSDSFTYTPHGTYVAGSATTVTIVVTAGTSPPTPPPPSHHNGSSGTSPLPPATSGGLFFAAADSATAPATNGTSVTFGDVAAATPNVVAQRIVPAQDVATADPVPSLPIPVSASPAVPLAPRSMSTTAMPWIDVTGLMAVSHPILLPSYTVAGDETASLLLPATPEISTLPEAFSQAVRRLTELQPAVVTFVDPSTGALAEDLSAETLPTTDSSWLLIDVDPDDTAAAATSSISWGSVPPYAGEQND